MTPAEKAKEIVKKFYNNIVEQLAGIHPKKYCKELAKACALIHVEGIMDEATTQYGKTAVDYGRETFWIEVKEAIKKM